MTDAKRPIRGNTPAPAKRPAPGDWLEDFSGENGNYYNLCVQCRQQFRGYKRRTICKQCAAPTNAVGQAETNLTTGESGTPKPAPAAPGAGVSEKWREVIEHGA